MRAFISSVRRGLEAERDALPGLIRAIGHEPVTFEQFTAQSTPSREACLRGVAESDVYVLLLGPHYGHRFSDTNQSPTHDEWTAARAAGKPTFVFRKDGVDLEPEQADFLRSIGDYGSGVFYSSFHDVADLQVKVAQALRDHANSPSPLTFEPVTVPFAVAWKDEWPPSGNLARETNAVLELHVIALDAGPIPRRMMLTPDALAGALRTAGAIPVTAGVDASGDVAASEIRVQTVRPRSGAQDAQFAGARLMSSGQLTLWSTLPQDQLGAILDEDDVARVLSEKLRFAGAVRALPGSRFGIAAGVGGAVTLLSRGKKTSIHRTSASIRMNPRPTRVVMDESVSAAALDQGAAEVAAHLGKLVIQEFDSTQ